MAQSGASRAVKTKRIRRDPETTRRLILDTTERVMIEEGYAAVSSRRIAQEIGLNAATIHYYYPTTDDLFIALHKRMTDQQLGEIDAVLSSPNPLDALWSFQSNWSQSALGVEFIALSNHRKGLQQVFAAATDAARDVQTSALERAITVSGFDIGEIPPIAVTTILVAIARALANEERVGITRGHAEVRSVVDWALSNLLQPKAVSR